MCNGNVTYLKCNNTCGIFDCLFISYNIDYVHAVHSYNDMPGQPIQLCLYVCAPIGYVLYLYVHETLLVIT